MMMHMNQDLFLEVLNGIWAFLDFALLGWFTYYIWIQVSELDQFVWYKSIAYWWANGMPGHINAAIAIYVFTSGDFIVRAYIWYWRHETNLGYDERILSFVPLIVGGVIAATGLLCKIRVFTVYKFGNKAWILSLAVAACLIAVAWATASTHVPLVQVCQ